MTAPCHHVHLQPFTRPPQVGDPKDRAAPGAPISDQSSGWQTADGTCSSKDKTAECWGWPAVHRRVLHGSTRSSRADLYVCKPAQRHAMVLHRRVGARNIMGSFFSYTQFGVWGNLRGAQILIWTKRQVRNRKQGLWVISTARSWTWVRLPGEKREKEGTKNREYKDWRILRKIIWKANYRKERGREMRKLGGNILLTSPLLILQLRVSAV